MVSATDRRGAPLDAVRADERRLVVCWQHPLTRAVEEIGLLTFDGSAYRFQYLERARTVDGFQPLIGFDDFGEAYESDELFPFFAQRVMDPRRPDYIRFVEGLSVDPDDEDSPWELLARTRGKREGDTIQLFPAPRVSEHGWECSFLVHGTRHMTLKTVPIGDEMRGKYSSEQFEEILSGLAPGDPLQLQPEPANEWTDSALLVLDAGGHPLGYVPNLLLEAVQNALTNGDVHLFVERVNPPEAGWHLRVLARLDAESDQPFDFFSSDQFRPALAS
ncbi:MAG: hypothetical protein J0H23_00295 [Micrococcales bacterium]|nr:hypothetical protein [Micrococcales bacterium]OJX66837.1 MAG: hypothetical protein BGO94_08380 [Micrococcales bacterium 72-143]